MTTFEATLTSLSVTGFFISLVDFIGVEDKKKWLGIFFFCFIAVYFYCTSNKKSPIHEVNVEIVQDNKTIPKKNVEVISSDASKNVEIKDIALPFITFLFCLSAYRRIRKDEELVRSMDRLR